MCLINYKAVVQGKYEYSKKKGKININSLDFVHKAKLEKKNKKKEKTEKIPALRKKYS